MTSGGDSLIEHASDRSEALTAMDHGNGLNVAESLRVPAIDPSSFNCEPVYRRLEKPWGWEIHWTPLDASYVGKVLHINEGARLSLQVHDEKQESWMLVAGEARILWQDRTGVLIETVMQQGAGYSCALGQQHRLEAITDCDIVEVSTPEVGTTWRIEDDYGRSHETPSLRAEERRI